MSESQHALSTIMPAYRARPESLRPGVQTSRSAGVQVDGVFLAIVSFFAQFSAGQIGVGGVTSGLNRNDLQDDPIKSALRHIRCYDAKSCIAVGQELHGYALIMNKTSKTTGIKSKTVKKAAPVTAAPAVSAVPVVVAAKPAPAVETPSGVRLELVQPGAKSVAVAGSFNAWKPEATPLQPAGNGRWTGSLKVNPGRYEYLFVVDGNWVPDPNAKEAVQNPFGGRNSVLVVSA